VTAMAIHIGTSGWSYNHWRDILYPAKASSLERLDHYAGRFRTVEVNNTFYRWPRENVFEIWRQRVPDGFLFSIKATRGLTHFRKLNDPQPLLERMEPGLRRLGDKLGVVLYQLPPFFACNLGRLEDFLAQAPKWAKTAMEFRHPSWDRKEVYEILERHGAAYCVMSGPNLPCVLRATAPFVFVRLHGPDDDRMYAGSYPDDSLRWWAERFLEWQRLGCDVFAYFNNDGFGNAVRNAETLRAMLGV
jgi:uncharacterized protein YecE (DUF72 family)